ncbi:porin [Pseudorhodoferax sp. Leaf274]|uniref:porin n=1 Tax=Pseudorhodoferax sp. Leaf274 TaxID=1736318 RepID=UPI000703B9FE|nr:porin [Pseudorhodoferax sp. Leaf274]KQP44224.1 porin [Pseudorhodoferax sp. Leaf274]
MKTIRTTLAVAAAACCGTAALAQSSVTVFGTVDLGLTHLRASEGSQTGMSHSNANISRIGFRGVEDLGGGLSAHFWLEGGFSPDTGAGPGPTGLTSLSFNRRATVALQSGLGELRLGRDDSATFLNTLVFDPFLTNGVGGTNAFVMNGAPIQISNAISYLTPAGLGGFYGQLQYAPDETVASAAGKYTGARVGWRQGPAHVAASAGTFKGATEAQDVRIRNAAASYDFGMVQPMLLWATEKRNGVELRALQLGVKVPIGVAEIRAQVSRYDTSNSNADWRKFAIGYGYNLSKRTQVYATYAHIANSDRSQRSVGAQGVVAPANSLGAGSSGYEVGLRHFF